MKAREFNKKNLLKFADNLYKDDGEYEHYMPLCHGTMCKANGELTHCAIGEVYEYFIGKPIGRKILKKDYTSGEKVSKYTKVIETKESDHYRWRVNDEDSDIIHIADTKNKTVVFGNESEAIRSIIKELPNSVNKNNLLSALMKLHRVNDEVIDDAKNLEGSFIRRAKAIQKHLHKVANDYL